jgi:hypothetical protein
MKVGIYLTNQNHQPVRHLGTRAVRPEARFR